MQSAKESPFLPVVQLRPSLRATRRWLIYSATAAFASGCGARAVDLDGDGGASVNVNSNPDAIAPGVSEFLKDQKTAMKIAVDDKRVYWYEGVSFPCCDPHSTKPGVRSCLKSDCQSTITTYDSHADDPNTASLDEYVALAAAGDNVYWAQAAQDPFLRTILTCPSAGCAGAPRTIVSNIHFNSFAVDESHVYWTSLQDSAVFRLPLSGVGIPETIAQNETSPDYLALRGSHAYWIERANGANSVIKRAPKQGGGLTETLAMAQNQATALNVDAEFAYWPNSYSVGSILRCPLSGCPGGPEVMVANQPWISALAEDGKSIFWISRVDPSTPTVLQATVMRCPIDGCASAVETLAVQSFHFQGMFMAVDGSYIYWVAQGLPEPMYSSTFLHATIYRHKN
jgi:hypothetical protein